MHLRVDGMWCSPKSRTPAVTSAVAVSPHGPSEEPVVEGTALGGVWPHQPRKEVTGPLSGAAVRVRFHPSQGYGVKSSCDEGLVPQRDTGPSVEGRRFALEFQSAGIRPSGSHGKASQVLWPVTGKALVFSTVSAEYAEAHPAGLWRCVTEGPHPHGAGHVLLSVV